MDALKNNLPIPNKARIRPFCYFNAVVLSSPLEKCKLAIDESQERGQSLLTVDHLSDGSLVVRTLRHAQVDWRNWKAANQ